MYQPITIHVDPDVAGAYLAASPEDRRKLDLLMSLRLQEATSPGRPLDEIMRDISREARSRGLTPEKLESLLDED
jgi:hypothetical protein